VQASNACLLTGFLPAVTAKTRAAYDARCSKRTRSTEQRLEEITSLLWTRAGRELELETLELRGANARREVVFLEERARIRHQYATSPLDAAAASREALCVSTRAELRLRRLVTSAAVERRAIEALDARVERLRIVSEWS